MLHPSLFDPTGLGSLPRVPLVPPDILRRHHCLRTTDDPFTAAARLLQSLWRTDRNLPPGTHTSPDGKRRLLGSRLSPAAGRAGAGFLTPEIWALVRRELVYREIGAVIDPDRLCLNLLSSQQLTFNLFGPLKRNLALATGVFRRLLPGVEPGCALNGTTPRGCSAVRKPSERCLSERSPAPASSTRTCAH